MLPCHVTHRDHCCTNCDSLTTLTLLFFSLSPFGDTFITQIHIQTYILYFTDQFTCNFAINNAKHTSCTSLKCWVTNYIGHKLTYGHSLNFNLQRNFFFSFFPHSSFTDVNQLLLPSLALTQFTYSLVNLHKIFTQTYIHSLTHSLTCIDSQTHLFTHSLIHPLIHIHKLHFVSTPHSCIHFFLHWTHTTVTHLAHLHVL